MAHQPSETLSYMRVAQLRGAEWAQSLLGNDKVMHSLCVAEFRAADMDGNGTISEAEAHACITKICHRFGFHTLPREEKCSELFARCDASGDGVLQVSEFNSYFRTLLRNCVKQARRLSEVSSAEVLSPGEGARDALHTDAPLGATLIAVPASAEESVDVAVCEPASPPLSLRTVAESSDRVPILGDVHHIDLDDLPSQQRLRSVRDSSPQSSRSSLGSAARSSLRWSRSSAPITRRHRHLSVGSPRRSSLASSIGGPASVRLVNRKLMEAFAKWCARSTTTLRASIAASRLLHSEISRGWQTWISTHERRAQALARLGASVGHWGSCKARRGWLVWVEMAVRRSEVMSLLRHAIAHLGRGARLSCGWNAWRAQWCEMASITTSLRHVAGHLAHGQLSQGWNTWSGVVHSCALLRRCLTHLAGGRLSRGWNTWVAMAATRQHARALLDRCVGHLTHRQLSRAHEAWAEMAGVRMHWALKLHDAKQFMSKLGKSHALVRGWNGWVSRSSGLVKKHAQGERSLRHLLLQGLSYGWNTWVAATSRLVRTRSLLRRGIGYLSRATVSRGWCTWRARAQSRARGMRQLRRGLGVFESAHKARGLATWIESSQRYKLNSRGDRQKARAISRLMTDGRITLGWNAWLSSWSKTQDARRALDCVIARLMYRQLSRGLNGWVIIHRARSHARAMLRRSVGHLAHRTLSDAYEAWVEMGRLRAELIGTLRPAVMAAQRSMANRWLSRGWTSWRDWVSVREHSREPLVRVASHWASQRLARGFGAWVEMALEMGAYLHVASMQFSHVVVSQPSAGAPRDVQHVWRCANSDKQDWALLHACQQGHLSTVETLVRRGAVVGVCDGLDQNALHVAAFEGYAKIVQALLGGASVEIDVKDAYGHTALMLASLRGHVDVMLMLVEAGADESL